MEEGGALHQLSMAVRDSLPSLGSIWEFNSQLMGNIISNGSGLVSATWEMGKELLPANDSLPSLDAIWRFINQKMGETISNGSVVMCSSWEYLRGSPLPMQIVRFTQESAVATLPYVKNALDFSVGSIKQHPYLFGLLILFLMAKTCSGGGSSGGKMMKAPGRNYRMARANFENNPKSYFRGLRGNSD